MTGRFWGTALLTVLYRSGKRELETVSMCASPRCIIELENDEPEIAESSSDVQHQPNLLEQSVDSSTVSADTLPKMQNLIDPTASGPDEGTKLSKRAIKRLRRFQLKQQKQTEKKCKTDSKSDKQPKSDIVIKDSLCESDYYFQDGLRKVYPYHFNYKTYAKERWFGVPLVSVFLKEFRNYSADKIKRLIESQVLTVNGIPIQVDYVLKNGDLIENRVHRHELPVTAEPIEIIADSSELLVVNKPPTIPIHPCGRYRFNSLLYILAKENGLRNLRGLYRLDRLTSGLVMFSKTEAKTKEMMELMKKHQLQKEYICRVDGEFPCEPVQCNEPIDVLSYSLGIHTVGPRGKQSSTVFERLSYNGKTSVVKCKPVTGRTHQIRVHLQYLGFPIPNDPLYSSPVWGPKLGKGGDFGKSKQQLLADLEAWHSRSRYLEAASGTDSSDCPVSEQLQPDVDTQTDICVNVQPMSVFKDVCIDSERRQSDEVDTVTSESKQGGLSDHLEESVTHLPVFDSSRMTVDPNCLECQLPFTNSQPYCSTMYLHAYRYQGPDWCFTTPLPRWAHDDWSD